MWHGVGTEVRVRTERTEGLEREVENEPAVRGPIAQESEPESEGQPGDTDDRSATRRGSSSERSER